MTEPLKVSLPDYERPPVIEVVMGVQFDLMPDFKATEVGLFWHQVQKDYPSASEAPALNQLTEAFEKVGATAKPQIEFLRTPPLPRVFLASKDDTWLIQLQRDRFLHNWRKQNDEDRYPKFPEVSRKFWSAWHSFLEFCDKRSICRPEINQLEITYINLIPSGEGWTTIKDVGSVFVPLQWRDKNAFLPEPETLQWKAAFGLPDKQGRLHISISYAIRQIDNRPSWLCEITTRGRPKACDEKTLDTWFEMGHEWIVKGFSELAPIQFQNDVWGRIR